MVFDVEVYPEMPRKKSKAVLEVNGPLSQDAYVMLGGNILEDLRRIMSEALDRAFDEPTENMRRANQRLVGLEQEAQQPCLAMEADVKPDTKNRKRTEGATAAEQAKHRDSCFSKRVQAGPTSSTSFGMKAEPPAPPRKDDVLVDKGAAAPKPCLSSVKMRTLTVTGDLLPAGKASTATRMIFYQLLLWFCPTEEINPRTTIQYAMDYSSFWKMNVLETKSRQNMVFDSGGYTGRLRACPFLGTWRALLSGKVLLGHRMVPEAGAFFGRWVA